MCFVHYTVVIMCNNVVQMSIVITSKVIYTNPDPFTMISGLALRYVVIETIHPFCSYWFETLNLRNRCDWCIILQMICFIYQSWNCQCRSSFVVLFTLTPRGCNLSVQLIGSNQNITKVVFFQEL